MSGRRQRAVVPRVLLTLAIFTLAGVSLVPSAGAAPFRMYPCGGDAALFERAWTFDGNSVWSVDGDCNSSMALRQQWLDSSELGPAHASLDIGSGRIDSVTLDVQGDASDRGVTQGFAVCGPAGWPSDCGDPVLGNPQNPSAVATVTLTRDNGGVPLSADRLVMFAQCNLALCQQGQSSVRFSNLRVDGDDATPPVVDFSQYGVVGDGPWRGSPAPLHLSASDPESRISRTEIRVNGALLTDVPRDTFCNPSDAWRCPLDFEDDPIVWTPNVVQGKNTITATTFNGAGLSSTAVTVVRVDSEAPHAPVSLTVGANAKDWVTGTRLVLRWQNPSGWESGPTDTQSGIAQVRYDIDSMSGFEPDPAPVTVDGVAISAVPITLPDYGEWRVTVWLIDAVGNVSDPSSLPVKNDDGFVRSPGLAPLPPVTAASVNTGVAFNWYAASAMSAICGYRTAIDHSLTTDLTNDGGGFTVDGPSPAWSLSKDGLLTIPDGHLIFHVQAVACSGARSSTVGTPLLIDRKLPTIEASPQQHWLSSDPHVSLNAADGTPQEDQSGIAAIKYSIDGAPEVSVAADHAVVTVPQGRHVLRYRAVDRVGNSSQQKSLDTGADSSGPDIVFESANPADPAEIQAVVSDPLSGLVDAWIEYCEIGNCDWQRIGPRFQSAGGTAEAQRLTAFFPDDGSLPDGQYMLRAVARDEAGNVSVGSSRTNGDQARLVLPLRPRPQLSATLAAATGKQPAAGKTTFDFGERTELRGRLLDAAGAPIAGAALGVVAERRYGGKRFLDAVTTSADGSYALRLAPDVSRTLVVRFAGDAGRGPVMATANQYFRAGVNLRASRKVVRRGSPLFLRGRVALMSAAMPALGKRVSIEYCPRGRCSNLQLSARTASDGSFAVQFPTGGINRTVRYRLRAVVPSEPGWPFADGASSTISVTVKR